MAMLTEAQISEEARRLYDAELARQQILPTTCRLPDIDLDTAYAIQHAGIKLKLANGDAVIGHKIGLTSRAMQMQMQIDEPDFGTLLESMRYPNNGTIPASDHLDPRIEVELAFVLKSPLSGTEVTVEQVLKATDYIVPCFELIAARTFRVNPETGKARNVFDTISDNAANAGVVLGDVKVSPYEVDLPWVGAICRRNNTVEETGLAAGVLDHPANGICWLAKRFAPHGIGLEPGQVVLSGSFVRPIAARPGDVFHADFGELGSVTCKFD